jgi:hypothetical protein
MGSAHGLLRILTILVSIAGLYALPGGPAARGQPPGFPDLNAFTEAPSGLNFSRPERWANGFAFFRTPDGIRCMVGSITRCSGELPGLPAHYGPCAAVLQTYEEATRSEPFRFENSDDQCAPSPDQLLDLGQKLTLTTNFVTTCVVGAGRVTACIQNDHGFVLQPSGSWTF